MRWKSGRRSENVEDRRRVTASGGMKIGGLGLLVIIIGSLLFGVNPLNVIQQLGGAGAPLGGQRHAPVEITAEQEEAKDFVSVVLADTEDTWSELFRQMGATYRPPKLVLFSGYVDSACGMAQAAVGPFYCPPDQTVYIDLSFFDDLKNRHHAPGDFAQAYVISHEIGHHVQNLLGISDKVNAMRGRMGKEQFNKVSVRLELQADFLAGVWAHHAQKARHIIESGDIEEALNAASRIGDDRLQMETRGYVAPDSFTHGTSEQRMRWFRRGLATGDMTQGDTFNAESL